MSDGLAAVTVTPGSTAALVSATLPLIEPVVLAPPPCANARVDANRQAASTATTRTNPRRFMNALLLQSLDVHSVRAQCSRPPCAFQTVVTSLAGKRHARPRRP